MAFEYDEDTHPHYRVLAAKDLAAGCDVWLVDHFVTFQQPSDFCAQLRGSQELMQRVAALVEADCPCHAADTTAAADTSDNSGGSEDDELFRRIKSQLHLYVHQFEFKAHAQSPGVHYKYLMDELGGRIRAAEEPSFMMSAFLWLRPATPAAQHGPQHGEEHNAEADERNTPGDEHRAHAGEAASTFALEPYCVLWPCKVRMSQAFIGTIPAFVLQLWCCLVCDLYCKP